MDYMDLGEITISQEWDDTLNQRIMIIYGDSLNDGINKNGQMDIISNTTKDVSYYHATYMAKHAKINYTTDEYYQKNIKIAERTFRDFLPIFIQNNRYNNIIFKDTTEDFGLKRYGMFCFPIESPTPEQYETLRNLISKLVKIGYEEFFIQGKTYVTEDKLLDNEIEFNLKGAEITSLEEIIKEYYSKNNIKKR